MSQIASRIKKITQFVAPLARSHPRLKPMHDITPKRSANDGVWTSTGDDPQFYFSLPNVRTPSGWYMVAIEVAGPAARDEARIYIDEGEGFSESASFSIPYHSQQLSKRLIKVPSDTKRLRFDPLGNIGEFTVSEFSLTAVTAGFAESKMLTKLMHCSLAQNYQSIEATQADLIKQADRTGQSYHAVLEQQYAALFSQSAVEEDYSQWVARVESQSEPSSLDIDRLLKSSSDRPLISILMPTFNSDSALLQEAVESVLAQSYSHWQMCISDGGSTDPAVTELIRSYTSRDDRIVAVFQSEPTGIAQNTNHALALAQGQYCLFLDHDDLLSRHAIFELVNAFTKQPQLKLVYSDEDKIDETGNRSQPHFKPDWNPDLLLAQNYICHLVAVETDLLRVAGGCREGFEGAQDHDLLLRLTQRITDQQVHHIPKILYHWRTAEGSTAAGASAKDYSSDSGVAAIRSYVESLDGEAQVEKGKYPNTYRVVWGLPDEAPLVSIIIPTRDRLDILSQCIDSVVNRTKYPRYEIIIVDNESVEPQTLAYFEKVEKEHNVKVLKYTGAFNYSAINNMAVRHARGSVITLMNNDIEVISEDWLREMVSHAVRPHVGCVGAKLLYQNNQVQHGGVILGIGGVAGHAHKYFDAESAGYFSRLHLTQNLSAVTAACLTVRKQTYLSVGGLNDSDLKVAFNDVDFCLKVGELGFRNVWTPYALLYHHESISRGHDNTPEKKSRFINEAAYMRQRWGDQLLQDPAYNRNLTLAHEDFSMAA